MERPSDAAIQIEMVKTHLRQSKEGVAVTFVLHPHDNNQPIVSAPVGTRYTCFFVETNDHGEPSVAHGGAASKSVGSAHLLCREQDFQQWLYENGLATEASEEGARQAIYKKLGITSRSEIGQSVAVRANWLRLRAEFMADRNYR
jgi:hypothetical protein